MATNVFIDLTGKRFERLTVIAWAGRNKHKQALWLCRCDCGNEKVILGGSLKMKRTLSCGCWNSDKSSERFTKHGHSGKSRSIEYQSWVSMLQRCTNPNSEIYKHYGGRGIIICERWLTSFENFLKDMGPRVSKEYSLERIEVNKGYSPDNCKWATDAEQANNKRIYKNNISGQSGVTWNAQKSRWQARIRIDGKEKHLGLYDDLEDAIEARKQAEIKNRPLAN